MDREFDCERCGHEVCTCVSDRIGGGLNPIKQEVNHDESESDEGEHEGDDSSTEGD